MTGLANRALLNDRLDLALRQVGRSGATVAVLYADLDGFKAVNDRLGHAAGDEILRAVAARLASHFRPGDTVARVGGDEFVIVCPELGVGAAVGAAGTEPEQLLLHADAAMYRDRRRRRAQSQAPPG